MKFFSGVKDGFVTFGTVLQSVGRMAEGGLDKGLGVLNQAWTAVSTAGGGMEAASGAFGGFFATIASGASAMGGAIMTALGAIPGLGWIILGIIAVVSGLVYAFQSNFMGLGDVFSGLGAEFGKMFGSIGSVLGTVLNFILQIGKAILSVPLALIVIPIIGIVKVLTFAIQMVNSLFSGIGMLFGWIGTLFTDPVRAIQQTFGLLGNMASSIRGFFLGVVNAMTSPFIFMWRMLLSLGDTIGSIFNSALIFGNGVIHLIQMPFNFIGNIFTNLLNLMTGFGTSIANVGFMAVRFFQAPFAFVWNIVSNLTGAMDRIFSMFVSMGGAFLSPFQTAWDLIQNIGGFVSSFFGGIGTFFGFGTGTPPEQHARGGIVGYAGGGSVQGSGTSTGDAVRALLSRGEYVVNAASAASQMPLLQAINGGQDVLGTLSAMLLQQSPLGVLLGGGAGGLSTLPMPFNQPVPPADMTALVGTPPPAAIPPIEINFNIASMVLGGGNSNEQAMEFLESVRPYLQHEVRDILRDLVDKTK